MVRANGGSDAFILGEVFDHEYYQLGLSFSPATILDLGANAGFTAVYFSRHYPDARIAAVEPIEDNLRILRHNTAANAPSVEIVAAAASIKDGSAFMELAKSDYGHKIFDGDSASRAKTVLVKVMTIPSMLRHLAWDRIGLLKMDIEGHEKILFSGDCEWLRAVDAMCIECHDGFGEPDLLGLAKQFGFLPPRRLPGIWLLVRA